MSYSITKLHTEKLRRFVVRKNLTTAELAEGMTREQLLHLYEGSRLPKSFETMPKAPQAVPLSAPAPLPVRSSDAPTDGLTAMLAQAVAPILKELFDRDNTVELTALAERAVAELRTHVEGLRVSELADSIHKVRKQIADIEAQGFGINIQIDTRKAKKIENRQHKSFKEALEILTTTKQLMIVGDAGTGKSFLAKQLSEALDLSFGFVNCTSGMSEAWLIGRMLANGTYVSAPFVDIFENGGVFLLDEADAADSNTLMVLQQALANGHMSVPSRPDKPMAVRHPECYIIVAMNTWGFGSNVFTARNALDAATLDRFVCSKVELDYDKQIEKAATADCPELADRLWELRSKVREQKVRRTVSTRAFITGAQLIANAQYDVARVMNVFFRGWTAEEKSKVGA